VRRDIYEAMVEVNLSLPYRRNSTKAKHDFLKVLMKGSQVYYNSCSFADKPLLSNRY